MLLFVNRSLSLYAFGLIESGVSKTGCKYVGYLIVKSHKIIKWLKFVTLIIIKYKTHIVRRTIPKDYHRNNLRSNLFLLMSLNNLIAHIHVICVISKLKSVMSSVVSPSSLAVV